MHSLKSFSTISNIIHIPTEYVTLLLLNVQAICTQLSRTSLTSTLDAPPLASHNHKLPFSFVLLLHLLSLSPLLLFYGLQAYDCYLARSYHSFHRNPPLSPHVGRQCCPHPLFLALSLHLLHLHPTMIQHENNPQTRLRVLLHAVIRTDLGWVVLAIRPHKPYSRVAPPLLGVEGY